MTDKEYISAAREQYADPSNNDIEIDDKPRLSKSEDGVWVQAWVWIYLNEN